MNWFRAGLKAGLEAFREALQAKVSGLASASTAGGKGLTAVEVHSMTSLMPAMELQAVRLLATNILREKHYIEITDVSQPGSFRIRPAAKLPMHHPHICTFMYILLRKMYMYILYIYIYLVV